MVGCSRDTPKKISCDLSGLAAACDVDREGEACRASSLATSDDFLSRLSSLDTDSALRELFSIPADVSIASQPAVLEAGVVFRRAGFSPLPITLPIDWSADPENNPTFRFGFHSLSWLGAFGEGSERPYSLESGAAVLISYERDAMRADKPYEMTWHDHAMALRLEHVSNFIERYIASGTVSRAALIAAARILSSQLAAVSADVCYRPKHNHGAAQDVAILRATHRFPLLGSAARRELATKRLLKQTRASVSARGVHLENSPGYQLYFAEILTQAVGALGEPTSQAATDLIGARDSMLESMVHLLQSNLTFPQFGDTDNKYRGRQIDRLLGWLRAENRVNPSADRLRWAVRHGRQGTAPTELDQLFPDAGFYATRDRWHPDGISVHMTCGFPSIVHYQPDEGSFEVAAEQRELIIDSGIFRHGTGRFADFQDHPRGQNVLVVNDALYQPTSKPTLTENESTPTRSVARCAHDSYSGEGIGDQVRTLTFERIGRLVVEDVGVAKKPADLVQLVMLHPDLSDVVVADDGTVTARSSDGSGPGLELRARDRRATVSIRRGVEEPGRPVSGWWFRAVNERRATAQIVFDYGQVDRQVCDSRSTSR